MKKLYLKKIHQMTKNIIDANFYLMISSFEPMGIFSLGLVHSLIFALVIEWVFIMMGCILM